LEYVSRFTNTNIILKFSRATITGTAHFILEEGFDVIQKPFTFISLEGKYGNFSMAGILGGEGNNLPISGY
jgi:hypothetical protein